MDREKLGMEIIEPENFRAIVGELPNPNEILSDRNTFFENADAMMCDPKIGSHLRLRKDIVASFPYRIEKGNARDDVYEFVRDKAFQFLNWDSDVKEFLSAIEYGFAISEVVWKNSGGYLVPDSLLNRDARNVGFKSEKKFANGILKTAWIPFLKSNGKRLDYDYKFLIYRNNPRLESPYGTSDLLMCFWPWKLKMQAYEYWTLAAKKAGVPTIVALFDMDSSDEKKAKEKADVISSTMRDIQGGSGLGLANVRDVKALSMSGALADHRALIEVCNVEISAALTTQSLSTAEAAYGSRAQADVHDENLVRVAKGDAKALQGVFQTLIDWTVELNFGKNEAAPKGAFDFGNKASYDEVMQAVQNRIPVSREALYANYGLPRPQSESDEFKLDEAQAAFAVGSSATHPLQFSDENESAKKKSARIF